MTGIKTIALKVALFAALSGTLLVLIVNTMMNGVPGDTEEYHAEFADVSGLRVGDDVKAAGVRVGQVTGIEATEHGANIDIELVDEQKLYETTRVIMRYANLVGQRYLALVQPRTRGQQMKAGQTVPMTRTDPGFDLTALLNGFRPLFEVLQPKDVNTLAESLVKVLQGEEGTVEQLFLQTANLTDFVADRDKIIGQVMTNLKPVLDNLAGQGNEITDTVRELRRLMTGLAKDRKSIGSSIDGISQLVGSTSEVLREVKQPVTGTTAELRRVAAMLRASEGEMKKALPAFSTIFRSLGKVTSYENALNIYVCRLMLRLEVAPIPMGSGPGSQACQ